MFKLDKKITFKQNKNINIKKPHECNLPERTLLSNMMAF